MKRASVSLLLASLFLLTVWVVRSGPGSIRASDQSRTESTSRKHVKPEGRSGATTVAELVSILNDTKSSDTFLVTLSLLKEKGAEAKAAIPDILKNAERLHLFADVLKEEESSPAQDKAKEIAEMVKEINDAGERSWTEHHSTGGAVCGVPSTPEPALEEMFSKNKERGTKLLLFLSCDRPRPEMADTVHDLAYLLRQRLLRSAATTKEKVSVVPVRQVEQYRQEHPGCKPTDMAQHFQADYLVSLKISSVSFHHPTMQKHLQGRVALFLSVEDVHHLDDDPVYEEECNLIYPDEPLPEQNRSWKVVRRKALEDMARSLASRFLSESPRPLGLPARNQ